MSTFTPEELTAYLLQLSTFLDRPLSEVFEDARGWVETAKRMIDLVESHLDTIEDMNGQAR